MEHLSHFVLSPWQMLHWYEEIPVRLFYTDQPKEQRESSTLISLRSREKCYAQTVFPLITTSQGAPIKQFVKSVDPLIT